MSNLGIVSSSAKIKANSLQCNNAAYKEVGVEILLEFNLQVAALRWQFKPDK